MKKSLIINSELLGNGNKELGKKLMGSFLRTLWANKNKPHTIILYNSGVKLITKESLVLDAMDGLVKAGVDIIACGTCIEFFKLKDKVVTGRISNMQEIVANLMESEQVITI